MKKNLQAYILAVLIVFYFINCSSGNSSDMSSVSIKLSFFNLKDSTAFHSLKENYIYSDLYYDYTISHNLNQNLEDSSNFSIAIRAEGIDINSFLGQPGRIHIHCLADSIIQIDTSIVWKSILFKRDDCNGFEACAEINMYISDSSRGVISWIGK